MSAAAPDTLDYERLVRSLVNRYGPAGSLPGALEPEDLAQQARLTLIDLAARWDGTYPFPAFVVANLGWALSRYIRSQDHTRRSKHVTVRSVPLEDLRTFPDHGPRESAWAAAIDCRSILEQLSAEHKSVLWMRYGEGHSCPEIGRVLGLSPRETEALLKQAMRAARAIVVGRLPQPRDDEADLAKLLDALREGVSDRGRLPGRHWVCQRTGLSELRVTRLMRRLVDRGVIVGRGPRNAGHLAESGGGETA